MSQLRAPALLALLCLSPACKESPKQEAQPTASATSAPKPSASAPAPAPPAKPPGRADEIVILAGGDVNLGRGAGQKILKDPKYNPFHDLAPLIDAADLTLVNLESQLSDQAGETQSPHNHLVFSGPPGGADVLARAGIDVVSIANNHAWDYGKSAFLQTLDNLERAKVNVVGGSRKPNQQYQPLLLEVKGWKVAIFAVTHIWNQGPIDKHEGRHYVAWAAFDKLGKRLERARREADLVLVSYHGGGEYVEVPMQWTRDFYRAVQRAGVDAILGHHPHVPLGVGWWKGRPAFYSLGNLVFAMHSDYPWTGTSFLARFTFRKNGQHRVEACPYHILGHTPLRFEGSSKVARERQLVSHLKRLSLSVGGSQVGEPAKWSCMQLSPPG